LNKRGPYDPELDALLERYVAEFDAQKTQDHLRIAAAGGVVEESRWVHAQAPRTGVIVARLPSAAALEKALTFQDDDGQPIVTARLSKEGSRRKLSLFVTLPKSDTVQESTQPTVEQLRASQASGISETRLAVERGTIVAARGFVIAGDKQSALLEPRAIADLLREAREVELFLEWDVTAP